MTDTTITKAQRNLRASAELIAARLEIYRARVCENPTHENLRAYSRVRQDLAFARQRLTAAQTLSI